MASKIAEEFSRPAVLLAIRAGLARGSGRSVPSFNLFDAIEACRDILVSYGGHEQAAGITLELANLERFRELFEQEAASRLAETQPCGLVEIDAEIDLGGVGHDLIRQVGRLAPFGKGNPAPTLACSSVLVAGRPRLMGGQGRHLSFYARQGQESLRAVGFGMGHLYDALAADDVVCDIAFRPKINDFRGIEEVELELCDIRLC